MVTWQNAKGADGPKVVRWLERMHLLNDEENVIEILGTTAVRKMYGWRQGRVAKIESLDRLLVQLGVHLSELPDDLFLAHAKRRDGADQSMEGQNKRARERKRREVSLAAV